MERQSTKYNVKEVAATLKAYELLYVHAQEHLIKENVLDKFSVMFPETTDMTCKELLQFFSDNIDGVNTNLSNVQNLNKFVTAVNRISFRPACRNEGFAATGLPDNLLAGLAENKKQEFCHLARYVDEKAKLAAVNTIVDVGCGQGEFTAILSHLAYQVIGVDSNEKNIDEAKMNSSKQWNTLVHYKKATISKDEPMSDILEDINVSGPVFMFSKAVGSLQRVVLESFIETPSLLCNTLIMIPEGFTKINFRGENGWMLSSKMKHEFAEKCVNMDDHGLTVAGGPGIELYIGATIESSLDFVREYYRGALMANNQEHKAANEMVMDEIEIPDHDVNLMMKFLLTQAFLQNCLATCILADEVLFLRDQGYDAGLESVWPRSHTLTAPDIAVVSTKLQQYELFGNDDAEADEHELDYYHSH